MVDPVCPHGDPTCPCPDHGPEACHYEGYDAFICPNPTMGTVGQVNPHCHMEGCDWHVQGCAWVATDVVGTCGIVKLHPEQNLFLLAKPHTVEWVCGWLRQPTDRALAGSQSWTKPTKGEI